MFFSSDAHRHLELRHGPADDVGDEHGALGRLPGVEHLEPPGGAVDQVDDVVEPGGQQVDVLPVERGDEHPVEPGDHLVGDLVGLVLQPLDLIHDSRPAGGVGPEQLLLERPPTSTVKAATALNRSKNFSSRGRSRMRHVQVTG